MYELDKFHLLLARIAGNSVLENILANLLARSALVMMLYRQSEVIFSHYDEHKEIVDALLKDDIERAQKLMRKHLIELQTYLDISAPLAASASNDENDSLEMNG
ncbi:FCD domain-containing protein [Duffyella gerundensis]|uniref:FCD domain-containing protein n=1 Tax=Duffyella gerundensis TaxID=1619313 RepID=UPI0021F75B13